MCVGMQNSFSLLSDFPSSTILIFIIITQEIPSREAMSIPQLSNCPMTRIPSPNENFSTKYITISTRAVIPMILRTKDRFILFVLMVQTYKKMSLTHPIF